MRLKELVRWLEDEMLQTLVDIRCLLRKVLPRRQQSGLDYI
jgi:hypothetical protein